MTATDTTTLTTIDELTTTIDDLHAELAGLPAAIHAAQRAGKVDDWLALQNRQEDIPGEIAALRPRLLTAQLDQALADLPALRDAERDAEAAAAEAIAAVKELAAKTPGVAQVPDHVNAMGEQVTRFDPDRWAAHQNALNAAGAHYQETLRQLDAARDATGLALRAVDDTEAALIDLGEDPQLDDADRPALTSNVILSPDTYGILGDRIAAMPANERTALAGTVPPRWIAQRMDPYLFEAATGEEPERDAPWITSWRLEGDMA